MRLVWPERITAYTLLMMAIFTIGTSIVLGGVGPIRVAFEPGCLRFEVGVLFLVWATCRVLDYATGGPARRRYRLPYPSGDYPAG